MQLNINRMKRISFFLVFTYISIVGCKAQMDSWMFNQQLNQMNMQMQMDQQQVLNSLMDMMSQVQKDAKVSCFVFPSGNDTFYAMIAHPFVSPGKLEIIGENSNGTQMRVPLSSCLSANNQLMTPVVFTPGMSVIVKRSDTGQVVCKESIPNKNSSAYNNYVQNGINNAQLYGNMMNSNASSGQKSESKSNNSTTVKTTCTGCDGRGWVPGSSTPTYGNTGTYKCNECNKVVTHSHSHDKCYSCDSKGYINRIR